MSFLFFPNTWVPVERAGKTAWPGPRVGTVTNRKSHAEVTVFPFVIYDSQEPRITFPVSIIAIWSLV